MTLEDILLVILLVILVSIYYTLTICNDRKYLGGLDTQPDISIRPIKKSDFDSLLPIVSDKSVMKTIADGSIWDSDKLHKYIDDALKDDISQKNSMYYIFTVLYDNEPVGIIQWKRKSDTYLLRIFLSRHVQGKGIGTKALKMSISHIKPLIDCKYLTSEVHKGNIASSRAMLKAGFKYDSTYLNYGKSIDKYII